MHDVLRVDARRLDRSEKRGVERPFLGNKRPIGEKRSLHAALRALVETTGGKFTPVRGDAGRVAGTAKKPDAIGIEGLPRPLAVVGSRIAGNAALPSRSWSFGPRASGALMSGLEARGPMSLSSRRYARRITDRERMPRRKLE